MPPAEELRKKVGQLFAAGFHGLTPDTAIKTLIRDYGLGAIVLFRRNVQDAAQLHALTSSLQQEAKNAGHEYPLLIGIDQENGLVTRITPPMVPQQPGLMALGATGSDSHFAYEVGKATGETLDFFGINMNYAPVCDINSEPLNPVIGVRSAGDNPNFVSRVASATAHGLREGGVVPTVKHFPGHGDTAVDSHYGLPVITKTRSELEKCELVPFRRAVAEGIEAVMTAHIALPNIGPQGLPATLSPDALNILRKDMKYDGVIITDCLEMDGIRATFGTAEGALMSLKAGSDSFMVCHTYEVQVSAIERICQAVESGEVPASRIDESLHRLNALKKRYLNWEHALDVLTTERDLGKLNDRHQEVAKNAYSNAATVVRNEAGVLPIPSSSNVLLLSPGGRIPSNGAVDKNSPSHMTFVDVLEARSLSVTEIQYSESSFSDQQWKAVGNADAVILTTRNAREAEEQRSVAFELVKRRKDLIVVATCSPYDFLDDTEIGTYLAIYEPTVEAFSAAVDIIFGKNSAKGALPVKSKVSQGQKASFSFQTLPFVCERDMEGVARVWRAALPEYNLPTHNLQLLLDQPHANHLVAREGDTVVGLCIAYNSVNRGVSSAEIAALAVDPDRQGKGAGTQLLSEAREYFREKRGVNNITLRSYFPRFWPGLPVDLASATQEFFVHRGFRLNESDGTDADLYQSIREFVPPRKYLDHAVASGFSFKAITSETFEDCLVGQKKNFTHYTGWVETYIALDPKDHPSSIMAAFDRNGAQIGWTLMLSPDDPYLSANWACPLLAGPRTGIIGCVGVDAAHRSQGVGLAMLCHALEDMKNRGIEAAFVDSTTKVDWYAKVGFAKWKEYRKAEI
ncbi:beta-N-acetylhexosaminidase [Talaromyces islandicus]|uniref:Beta-N-acetylhexosaminidase n=1 Tax=Talaromyces islandicus TaxID=28573 RepID=A0A0U1LU11_TALIS|nr:beta-N-acetylhexosaminidase [Talaromyces islandicus]